MRNTVVVTRHPALVEYLREMKIIDSRAEVIDHLDSVSQIRGRDVIGVLPLRFAAEANTITEVPLRLNSSDRGVELSIDRIREVAGELTTYTVRVVG